MQNTKIEWCDSTINGSSGCDGCELWNEKKRTCYAGQVHENRLAKSLPEKYAPSFSEVRMIPGRYMQAANWSNLMGKRRPALYDRKGKLKTHAKPWLDGKPRHIFVGDMGDFLSKAVTDECLERELLGAIKSKSGQRHIWMLLTKRPERLAELSIKWGGLPDNVIAMTTVTNQRTADVRIPHLLRVQCKTRGLSIEPLLSSVDLMIDGECSDWACPECGSRNVNPDNHDPNEGKWWFCPECKSHEFGEAAWTPKIHQVICGGESGPNARPMHPDWARSLRDQCVAAGVPFFFKQWGEWGPATEECGVEGSVMPESGIMPCGKRAEWIGGDGKLQHPSARGLVEPIMAIARMGKARAGRLLDGREWNQFPENDPAQAPSD